MPWIVYWFRLKSIEDQLLLVSTSSHPLTTGERSLRYTAATQFGP
jgi:hypothetical protein